MLNHRTLSPLWPGGQATNTPTSKPAAPRPAPARAAALPLSPAIDGAPAARHELLGWQPAALGRFRATCAHKSSGWNSRMQT
jgi:hypothetical protein